MCRTSSTGSHFATSYQRDMANAQNLRSADGVGTRTQHRGKRIVHQGATPGGASSAAHSPGSFLAPRVNTPPAATDRAVSGSNTKSAGHLPGYTGHVPKASPYQYSADKQEALERTHDKAFHLAPENHKHQVPGYSGRNMAYKQFSASCDRERH